MLWVQRPSRSAITTSSQGSMLCLVCSCVIGNLGCMPGLHFGLQAHQRGQDFLCSQSPA